ncbi:hypothetical protein ACFLRH_01830 [Actinomycetota bacterium]
MSIEIELYAERRMGDRWVLAESTVPNPWLHSQYRDLIDVDEAASLPTEVPQEVVDFGHSGIWSVLWGNSRRPYRHVPIIPPRGLPDDLSPDIANAAPRHVALFANGTGWYLLQELLDHDWSQVEQYRRYTRVRFLFGRRHWSWPTPWPWRRWEEEETHAQMVGQAFLDSLERLRGIDSPDRIRLVFYVGD